jgi:hypothetical protein
MVINAPYYEAIDLFIGREIPKNPVDFRYYMGGTKLDDCLSSPDKGWLWSDRLVMALNDAQITGFKLYSVILKDKQKEDVEGYSGVSIIGRAGKIDLKKSQIIREQPEGWPKIIERLKGMYFGLKEWDGSDIFLAENQSFVFCTKKFVDTVSKLKGHNFEFTPVSEYRRDISDLEWQLEKEAKESGEVD